MKKLKKAEIMASPWYSHKRAQLDPLLKDNETYTIEQVESLLRGGQPAAPSPANVPEKFAGMTVEQLKVYASTNGIDIGNSSSVNGITKKIVDAEALKAAEAQKLADEAAAAAAEEAQKRAEAEAAGQSQQ